MSTEQTSENISTYKKVFQLKDFKINFFKVDYKKCGRFEARSDNV